MNDKINLELTVNDANLDLSALRKMPYRLVNDIINNIVV